MQSYNVDGGGYKIRHGALFEALCPPRSYGKNQIIYQQGDAAEHVYYLKSGKVKVYIAGQEGHEKTLTVMTAGDLFGKASFFDGSRRPSSAKALVKSEIIVLDRRMMAEVFRQKPDFALELLTYLSKTIRMLSTMIDGLAFMEAETRLARFLYERHRETGGDVLYTHEDIGEQTGLSRITVSRILGQFRRNGWIDTAYRRIIIRDPGALADYLDK